MNEEVNFCPFCDAPSHKLLNYQNHMYFCRECNSFLSIKPIRLKCLKCDSEKIEDSDFPSPDGQIILQCKMCKKMFTAKELLEKLNIKDDSPKEEEKKEEQKPQEPKKKRQAKDW